MLLLRRISAAGMHHWSPMPRRKLQERRPIPDCGGVYRLREFTIAPEYG